jgi:phosphoribosylanthranilate isomerase
MTWVKICGITNLQDAQLAVEAGADAIGFVFYRKSPRKVETETVRAIVEKISESVEKVGVFVDETPNQIHEMVSATGLTAVQLQRPSLVDSVMNGPESPAELLGVGKVIPAISGESLKMGGVLISQDAREKMFALLFDSQANGVLGGTGTTFDWQGTRGMIQVISLKLPVIVAGGLTPANVTQAIRLLKPFGVDVSSGVEAKPGKKDPDKIRAFVQAARSAGKTA